MKALTQQALEVWEAAARLPVSHQQAELVDLTATLYEKIRESEATPGDEEQLPKTKLEPDGAQEVIARQAIKLKHLEQRLADALLLREHANKSLDILIEKTLPDAQRIEQLEATLKQVRWQYDNAQKTIESLQAESNWIGAQLNESRDALRESQRSHDALQLESGRTAQRLHGALNETKALGLKVHELLTAQRGKDQSDFLEVQCYVDEIERLQERLKTFSEREETHLPDGTLCFFEDGDQWVCVAPDFSNLQESPAGFGHTYEDARKAYHMSARVARERIKQVVKPDAINRPGYDALWLWFGLSHASWITLPRVIVHAMPDKWQLKMAELLAQYDEEFGRLVDLKLSTVVCVKGDDNRYTRCPDWLLRYRHPDKEQINRLRTKPHALVLVSADRPDENAPNERESGDPGAEARARDNPHRGVQA